MRLIAIIAAAVIGVTGLAPPADAERPRPREQDRAWLQTREGRILPLPRIEAMILPKMRGTEYLGPEFNGERYRLKFMARGGQVMWIDVDARTGRVLGKTGF